MGPWSKWEEMLAQHILAAGLSQPTREFRFHPVRRWRFDFAWPDLQIAVEVEGVMPGGGGRHQRFLGYEADLEKYNSATYEGWRVLRFTGRMVQDGRAIQAIECLLRKIGA
jgi:very-short-patch-repair endonuclease